MREQRLEVIRNTRKQKEKGTMDDPQQQCEDANMVSFMLTDIKTELQVLNNKIDMN